MFFKGSRYADVEEVTIIGAGGRVVRYKKTRFVPDTSARAGHVVSRGERLDLIADYYFRAPERYWRICDANIVMQPDELEQDVGRKIDIPESQ